MGTSKLNLSNAECRNSPSLNGSMFLKQSMSSRAASHDKSLDESGRDSKMNSSSNLYEGQGPKSPVPNLNTTSSCDNVADDSNELNDSFEGDEGESPSAKKARQEVRFKGNGIIFFWFLFKRECGLFQLFIYPFIFYSNTNNLYLILLLYF